MADFDNLNPPKKVTNPTGPAAGEAFPRHVHKYAGKHDDGSPKLNAFKVIANAGELEAALADGWSLEPVLDEPKKSKSKAADKGDKGDGAGE